MKKIKSKLALLLIVLIQGILFAQSPYNFKCGMEETEGPDGPFGQGLTKPMKTLPVNDETKFFRVLLVYVEFLNDTEGESWYWTPGQLPDYANQVFAPQKDLGLNAYEDYYVSDYFNKISMDEFDMVGDVKHITLPFEYSHYSNHQNGCYNESMLDVLRMLDTSSNYNDRADWQRYDLWRYNTSTQEFEMYDDGNIDMIYIQFRRADLCGMTSGGYGALYVDYTTINYNKEINGCGICYEGSGLMGINGWKMSLGAVIGYFRHEYCHYTLGNHVPYSTILGGDGSKTCYGSELGFSPQDLITVGLANVTTFNPLSSETYEIEDMATAGEVLKVPINSLAGEYFLVSNRRRILNNDATTDTLTWDCNMTGDTSMGRPFKQYWDYSKGLYIYHVQGGNGFEAWADLEAADGFWNWELAGYNTTPFWSSTQQLPVFKKTGAGYLDYNPTIDVNNNTRMSSRDGQSLTDYTNSTGTGYHVKWFTKGERHTALFDQGTDRVFTNLDEDWNSCETMGDRWDALKIDYNQIFSPYSSPNTKNRNNENTGIFIYYTGLSGNVATVKIYQTGEGYTEDEILEATPPSKPILFREIEVVNCNGTYGYPKIIWDNNKEPDMLRNNEYKRYKIYRAQSNDMNTLPDPYSYIATYDDYTPNDTVSYIDLQTIISCGWTNVNERYYRYKVVAVDSYDDESVKSDFAAIQGASSMGGDNYGNNSMPLKFDLSQNYPNPFNPSTTIKYTIPYGLYVTVNVYNVLGELVDVLVNNVYRNKGQYEVTFEGLNLSSGVYFYTIEAGTYYESKKMVLIK